MTATEAAKALSSPRPRRLHRAGEARAELLRRLVRRAGLVALRRCLHPDPPRHPCRLVASHHRDHDASADCAAAELLAQPTTVVSRGTTYNNAANLAPEALAELERRYAGTRIGRQELDGALLDDVPGALWLRSWFDRDRVDVAPDLARVVVDPGGDR